jgi:hypothetical protein
LADFDIHFIEYDDVMARVILETLVEQAYELYLSLPAQSISPSDDLENILLTMYAPPLAYHTLLTHFTQIHFKNIERIKDFNLIFFNTMNQIPEEKKKTNALVVFGCYKNTILTNVNYAIRSSRINTLCVVIQKEMNMEEFMLETKYDPEIILEKVPRK